MERMASLVAAYRENIARHEANLAAMQARKTRSAARIADNIDRELHAERQRLDRVLSMMDRGEVLPVGVA